MKAVLLDVYGTLLQGHRVADPDPVLRKVAAAHGFGGNPAAAFRERIADAHRRSPEPYPEVDVREIWRDIFPGLADPETFSLAAENAVHRVTAMPGAADAIRRFHQDGARLGVVSNGQAYTRRLLAGHLGDAFKLLEPELLVFSYEHRIAKPDPRLFQVALDRLGLAPGEVLFIGDSATQDIRPAAGLGMRTQRFQGWTKAV